MLGPETPAVGAGAHPLAAVTASHHGTGRQHDRREIDAGSRHHLGGQRFVAAADDHHRVHGLCADHLLCIHRHEVPEKHRGGVTERLAEGDGGKDHGQGAGEHYAAFDALDESRHIAVAGIEIAEGVGDGDDGAVERLIGIPHGLNQDLSQKQGEVRIAVTGQPLS